jgi:hypothetical protein
MQYNRCMSKILNSYWFNGGGIIRVETDYDGICYFIGCPPSYGLNTEEEDIRWIADWGNSFPVQAGDVLFGIQ